MPDLELQKLFGQDGLSAKLEFADIHDLTRPVSAGPLPAGSGALSGLASVPVLGRRVGLAASLEASAEIKKVGEALTLYRTDLLAGEEVSPGEKHAFAELRLDGKVDLSGKGDVPVGLASVGLSGSACAELELQHLLAVPADDLRAEALLALAQSSLLPGSAMQIDRIGPGDLHRLSALFELGLNASVQAGWEGAVERALFDGLDSEVEAAYKATMQASFGLSLYEKLDLSVGTLAVDESGWVRVTMERVSQERFTLGALLSLQVKYDLGSGLTALLDHLLGLVGWDGIEKSLTRLSDLAEPIAQGRWDEVKAGIDDKTVELLERLLSLDDFLDSVVSQGIVQDFVGLASRAVEAYQSLEPRLQSLFGRVLGYADLEPGAPIRQALESIAGLKGKSLDDLLKELVGDKLASAVDLLEALTGSSLEDLVVGPDGQQAVERAADAAAQAVRFLNDFPSEVVDKIHQLAKRSGVAEVIDFLQANATSVADLRAKLGEEANRFIGEMVERITGKLLGQLDAGDLARIQSWAARMKAVLDDITGADDRLKQALAKLEGEVGFSLGIELDRMTRKTRLLDVELDPEVDACRKAFRQLRTGDLGGFLEELPDLDKQSQDGDDLPYQIRQCTFLSQRVRSAATSIFFSVVGWNKSKRRRDEEMRIEIEQLPDDSFRRTGSYSGGLVATYEGDGQTWSGGMSLVARSRAADKVLFGDWDEVSVGLRLTSVRDDESTTRTEISALAQLLADLGFEGAQGIEGLPVPHAKAATRLSLTVETGEAALEAFLRGLSSLSKKEMKEVTEWDLHVRNAAYRWFDTLLIPTSLNERPGVPKGPVLAGVVKSPSYAENWRSGTDRTYTLTLGDNSQVGINTALPPYRALFTVAYARGEGVSRLPRLRADYGAAKSHGTHQALRKMIRRSGRTSSRLTPRFWESPLFTTWLLMAKLAHDEPAALKDAKGLATFRWKDSLGKWSPPHRFTLGDGLAQHLIGNPVFPIR